MTKKTGALLLGAIAVALAPLSMADAQAAQQPAIQQGPPIAGLCVLSTQGLIGASTVGKYVQTRLQQLAQTAQADITSQQTSLQNDEKAFQTQRAGLSGEQLNQRAQALAQRERDLERLVDIRRQEMQATQQKAFGRVLTEADPVVRQLYVQQHCSILLDAQNVLIASPNMDLTQQTISGLNAKITQFTFDREHLDQNAQGR